MLMFQLKYVIINPIKTKIFKKGGPFFHDVSSRHDTSLVTVETGLGVSRKGEITYELVESD